MYGPDLSPVFRGCLIGIILLVLVSIVAGYFGIRFFTDEDVVESMERINPEIRLQIDDTGYGIDTIFVYKKQ